MRHGDWDDEEDVPEAGPASPGGREEQQALQELRAVYRHADAAYAPFSCSASGECCQLAVTRRQPWLWLPEWRLLRRHHPLPPPRADGGCPYLDAAGKRCTVYADRPFGCRTFFCARIRGPAQQPKEAVISLSRRIEFISQRMDPQLTAPRPLLDWYAGDASAQEE